MKTSHTAMEDNADIKANLGFQWKLLSSHVLDNYT